MQSIHLCFARPNLYESYDSCRLQSKKKHNVCSLSITVNFFKGLLGIQSLPYHTSVRYVLYVKFDSLVELCAVVL